MANKMMIVSKCISQINCYKGTLVTSRGLEFASQLWLLSLIYREGIDAGCGKTEDLISREPKEIETSTTRRFEDNRLNCVVTEPDF